MPLLHVFLYQHRSSNPYLYHCLDLGIAGLQSKKLENSDPMCSFTRHGLEYRFSSVSHLSRPGSCEESQVAYRGEASGWCPSTFGCFLEKRFIDSPLSSYSPDRWVCCWFKWHRTRSIVRKDCVGNKSKDPMKSQAARNLQEAISDCEITLDFSSMKVQNKECEMSTKLWINLNSILHCWPLAYYLSFFQLHFEIYLIKV